MAGAGVAAESAGKQAAHGLARAEDVRLARRLRRTTRREHRRGSHRPLPDGANWTLETVSNARLHLIGTATYARWAQLWPAAPGPDAKPTNEIPTVVFSHSLQCAGWPETTIVSCDLTDAITRLKQEHSDGSLLVQGGVRFARSLVQAGLIDEYRLVILPVVLGAGEPLFTTPLTIEPISHHLRQRSRRSRTAHP